MGTDSHGHDSTVVKRRPLFHALPGSTHPRLTACDGDKDKDKARRIQVNDNNDDYPSRCQYRGLRTMETQAGKANTHHVHHTVRAAVSPD